MYDRIWACGSSRADVTACTDSYSRIFLFIPSELSDMKAWLKVSSSCAVLHTSSGMAEQLPNSFVSLRTGSSMIPQVYNVTNVFLNCLRCRSDILPGCNNFSSSLKVRLPQMKKQNVILSARPPKIFLICCKYDAARSTCNKRRVLRWYTLTCDDAGIACDVCFTQQ